MKQWGARRPLTSLYIMREVMVAILEYTPIRHSFATPMWMTNNKNRTANEISNSTQLLRCIYFKFVTQVIFYFNNNDMSSIMSLRKRNGRPKGALSLVELYSHCIMNVVHHICSRQLKQSMEH